MCIFETTLSTYGTCKQMISLSDDTSVLPLLRNDMLETDTTTFMY